MRLPSCLSPAISVLLLAASLPTNKANVHLEADIHALSNNTNGFAKGE